MEKKRRKIKKNRNHSLVGRALANKAQAGEYFKSVLPKLETTISNNVGVGILSYNRLPSVKRLIQSIRAHTNLHRVTVFVSDESDDDQTKKWLNKQKDIVVLCNKRKGVAANTNRLLKCLERFRYKFLLNDDAEILQKGWCDLYIEASKKTGYHHFCHRQPGVYGAKDDATTSVRRGVEIDTVHEKPQGGMLFLTHQAFERVGYFDTKFGLYGMEHVDYSRRVGLSGIQPKGYHDVAGSTDFIKLHGTASVVEKRTVLLREAREYFEKVKTKIDRIHIPYNAEDLPTLTYVIPCRGNKRTKAIATVVNCIRAQRFPVINIILVEQDSARRVDTKDMVPIEFVFVKSAVKGLHSNFNKSEAFNVGVTKCTTELMVLHDADMLAPPNYSKAVYTSLAKHDACHLGSTVIYMSGVATKHITTGKSVEDVGESSRVVGYFEGGSVGCKKQAYRKIGGFNEEYIGYGMEDCDFYRRLLNYAKFHNNRIYNFVHLEHDRTPGWETCHERNKKIDRRICKTMTPHKYIEDLRKKLKRKYG